MPPRSKNSTWFASAATCPRGERRTKEPAWTKQNWWLPATYEAASAPAAALFMILTKIGIYAMLRVNNMVFGAADGPLAGLVGTWLARRRWVGRSGNSCQLEQDVKVVWHEAVGVEGDTAMLSQPVQRLDHLIRQPMIGEGTAASSPDGDDVRDIGVGVIETVETMTDCGVRTAIRRCVGHGVMVASWCPGEPATEEPAYRSWQSSSELDSTFRLFCVRCERRWCR